jgi:hypothetical protein
LIIEGTLEGITAEDHRSSSARLERSAGAVKGSVTGEYSRIHLWTKFALRLLRSATLTIEAPGSEYSYMNRVLKGSWRRYGVAVA